MTEKTETPDAFNLKSWSDEELYGHLKFLRNWKKAKPHIFEFKTTGSKTRTGEDFDKVEQDVKRRGWTHFQTVHGHPPRSDGRILEFDPYTRTFIQPLKETPK